MNKNIIYGIYLVAGLFLAQWTIFSVLADGVRGAYLPLAVFTVISIPAWPKLSTLGLIAMSSASLQLPIPMKPQLWHLLSALSIPALLLMISVRKLEPQPLQDRGMRNWVLFSLFVYVVAMFVSATTNGVGFRDALSNVGGREYIKHTVFVSAFLGMIFLPVAKKPAQTAIRASWLFALTFAVTDVVAFVAPGALGPVRLFFQIPGDFANFIGQSELGMAVRLQGVGLASIGVGCWLISCLTNQTSGPKKMIIMLLVVVCMVGVGMSGYRRYLPILPLALAGSLYARNRLFRVNTFVTVGLAGVLLLVVAYTTVNKLPLAVQRSLQVLPGMEDVTKQNFYDTKANDAGRAVVKEEATAMLEDEWITGTSFMHNNKILDRRDQIKYSLAIGYNSLGYLSLLLHLGLLGFLASMSLMIAAIVWSYRNMKWYSRVIPDDPFSSSVGVVFGVLFYTVFYYCLAGGNGLHFFKSMGPPMLALILVSRIKIMTQMELEAASREATFGSQEASTVQSKARPSKPPFEAVPAG